MEPVVYQLLNSRRRQAEPQAVSATLCQPLILKMALNQEMPVIIRTAKSQAFQQWLCFNNTPLFDEDISLYSPIE